MKALIASITTCILILNPFNNLHGQIVDKGEKGPGLGKYSKPEEVAERNSPTPPPAEASSRARKSRKAPRDRPDTQTVIESSIKTNTDHPVHLFILSGQSNMAGMNPETGFLPEAEKLFGENKVGYIKVAKGGQPICRWLVEWEDIAKEKGLDERHRQRILKGEGVLFYQPILDEYKAMLEKHPQPKSVTFCWMQGERDANGGAQAAYKDALKQLIANLRRDLERPDMNIVIGRIGDYAIDNPQSGSLGVRKAQREIVDEDPRGAWVDVDDLNDKLIDGVMKSVVHYNRPEGYVVLGQRFARQGHALVTGEEPAADGRPKGVE